MKRIVFIRHSNAEEEQRSSSDFDRKLTKEGIKKATEVASKIKTFQIYPEVIISSSAARAKQTACIFASVYGIKEDAIFYSRSIYSYFDADILLNQLSRIPASAETVFVFGHNPTISKVAHYFANEFTVHFEPSGAAIIEFSVSNWLAISANSGSLVKTL